MFKPGDEVECVRGNEELVRGAKYVVCEVGTIRGCIQWVLANGEPGVSLVGVTPPPNLDGNGLYRASRFRKVQRNRQDLSIERFLTIKPDQYEEPKRTPDKERKKEEVK